jgi:hypothetical protein
MGILVPDASTVLPDSEVVREAFERSNRTVPVDESLERSANHDQTNENAEVFEDSNGSQGERETPSPSPASPRTPTASTLQSNPSAGEFEELLL